jgi:hypothetical protein
LLNPIQPEAMDIVKLKANFGDKLTFLGGISTQQTLPYGTPEQVRKETLSIRAMMSKGGGYITAPAQEIQTYVPIENVWLCWKRQEWNSSLFNHMGKCGLIILFEMILHRLLTRLRTVYGLEVYIGKRGGRFNGKTHQFRS